MMEKEEKMLAVHPIPLVQRCTPGLRNGLEVNHSPVSLGLISLKPPSPLFTAIQLPFEGAAALTARAVELIDMRQHTGSHPRMGAVDVVPFVPLGDATLDECVELARDFGSRIATRYDRRAIHFLAFIHLASAMLWMR